MSSPPAILPSYGSLTPPQVAEKGSNMPFTAQYPAYVPVAPLDPSFSPAPAERRRCRRRRVFSRILHAFLFTAVIVWLWPTFKHNIAHFSRKAGHFFGGGDLVDGDRPWTGFEDVDDCVRFAPWTDIGKDYTAVTPSAVGTNDWPYDPHYPFAAKTSVSLPLSSDLLYLVSGGSLSHGHVEIAADGESDNEVTVDVIFLYHNEDVLNDAKVCYLERRRGEKGVGIFSPRYHRRNPDNRARFAVKVRFPAQSGKDVLQVKGFETSLPLFTHVIDDLENVIAFKTLELRGSNSPIYAKTVFAEAASIETSNSPIVGNYTTSDSLVIRTSNSPIVANATLISSSGHTTEIELRTSNGQLASNITLVSTAKDHTGGKFKVSTRTSNSPLTIDFVTAPVDSLLDFEGQTSNSPARAKTHPTFEGNFWASTSTWFPVSVTYDENVEDPAGKGRERHVELKRLGRSEAEGTVKWVPAGEEKTVGRVNLHTSNSPIHLSL